MLTWFFVVTKLVGVLNLSWWWIILMIAMDGLSKDHYA